MKRHGSLARNDSKENSPSRKRSRVGRVDPPAEFHEKEESMKLIHVADDENLETFTFVPVSFVLAHVPETAVALVDIVHLLPEDASDHWSSTRFHASSGWTIGGVIHADWVVWVSKFQASHPQYGTVRGDFAVRVEASSQAAYDHFVHHHRPRTFEDADIVTSNE